MGSIADPGTRVTYHRDNPFGDGRPAINVKVHGFDRETFTLIENAIDGDEAMRCFEIAEGAVFRRFWNEDVVRIARIYGFEVEQTGRSGGWVEITNLDPMTMEEPERKAFLINYRAFEEWCDREVAEAPKRIGRLAQEIAISDKVATTVTMQSIAAFEDDPQDGIIKLAVEMGFTPA